MTVSEQLRTYPPSLPNINPDLISVDCCWARGGVGAQLHRYWHWYSHTMSHPDMLPNCHVDDIHTVSVVPWAVCDSCRVDSLGIPIFRLNSPGCSVLISAIFSTWIFKPNWNTFNRSLAIVRWSKERSPWPYNQPAPSALSHWSLFRKDPYRKDPRWDEGPFTEPIRCCGKPSIPAHFSGAPVCTAYGSKRTASSWACQNHCSLKFKWF